MQDEIMLEVWKAKDTIASRHGHDVKRLAEQLRLRQEASGSRIVDLHARHQIDKPTG